MGSREEFANRPICHFSVVKDAQVSDETEDGSSLTSGLCSSIEDSLRAGEYELSVAEVYNACLSSCEDNEGHTFKFEHAHGIDPDTFPWPLMPPEGWTTQTMPDTDSRAWKMPAFNSPWKGNGQT